MAVVTVAKEQLVSRAKIYNDDALWFSENIDSLRERYAERYVAVHKKELVDSDRGLRKLLSRLKEKYPSEEVGHIFIQYVTKTKIDLII